MGMMTIAISGATGFIGSYLTEYFRCLAYEVIPLTRKHFQESSGQSLRGIIGRSQVVINLAGVPILHKWTERYKKEILESRIQTTRKLVETMHMLSDKPQLFISASAIGYYPSEGCYDEFRQRKGKGFLADVCEQWEEEAEKISPDVRLAITRFGIVLAPKGGAFSKLTIAARHGIGTIIGDGKQPFSWIDIRDLSRAMEFIIENKHLEGVINFTAPEQITNEKFIRTVAHYHASPVAIQIPTFLFKTVLGEAAQFLVEGQCASPLKLIKEGFVFYSPTTTQFLQSIR